jgi:hypothetical protein
MQYDATSLLSMLQTQFLELTQQRICFNVNLHTYVVRLKSSVNSNRKQTKQKIQTN